MSVRCKPMTDAVPAPEATTRRLWLTALPVATAIGVFGVIYGATAAPVLGAGSTVLSSLVIFSGAAQFTMVALVGAGAGVAAVIGATAALAVRHLPFGAVLRSRLTAGRLRRAALAPVLIDETAGLAIAETDAPAERVLLVAGGLSYAAFAAGTAVGVAGGTVADVEPLAAALFPVLFVGLAAITVTCVGDARRAVTAGLAAAILLALFPGAGAIGVIAVALVVAAPVTTRRARTASDGGGSR